MIMGNTIHYHDHHLLHPKVYRNPGRVAPYTNYSGESIDLDLFDDDELGHPGDDAEHGHPDVALNLHGLPTVCSPPSVCIVIIFSGVYPNIYLPFSM